MRVGDYPRALDEYSRAAALQLKDPALLAQAGRAAFQLGRYELAHQYLHQALVQGTPIQGTKDASVAQLADVVDAVLALDPYRHGLTDQERSRRVVRAFGQAGKRLMQCGATSGELPQAEGLPAEKPGPTTKPAPTIPQANRHPQQNSQATQLPPELENEYSQWRQLKPQITERALRHNNKLLDTAMDLVFQIEQQAESRCGSGSAADTALVLISRETGTKELNHAQ
jgi:tetratricopeptide (TPR) repeat protein